MHKQEANILPSHALEATKHSMNSKNEDSAFSLRLIPEHPVVMDGGAQAATDARNYLGRPSPA